MNYTKRRFADRDVRLDGNCFFDCTFEHCVLLFGGGQVPVIEGCHVLESRFSFDGAASRAVDFLAMMYRMGFASTVELAFDDIKTRYADKPFYSAFAAPTDDGGDPGGG